MRTLGDDYPKQQARCRALLQTYKSLPDGSGVLGSVFIEATLREADEAAIYGDLPRMMAAYLRMKEHV